jgi:acetoin utilization deacetylase AcuC-like enzyme
MTKKVLMVTNSQHADHNGRMNECADRLEAVKQELSDRGLWERCVLLDSGLIARSKVGDVNVVASTALHTAAHMAALRDGYTNTPNWNCSMCTFSNTSSEEACQVCEQIRSADIVEFVIPEGKSDVYLCKGSLAVALANCNACCHAAKELVRNPDSISSVFCLVRPPGHHASSEHFGSYCLINTVAVVAKSLLAETTKQEENPNVAPTRKILIVDWDVHHGDGTQSLVENDPLLSESCKFVSIHRHDKDFWPKSGTVQDGNRKSIINIPLAGTGYADQDYYHIFEQVIVPVATNYQPDLILVSAGYDCAQGDPLGRFSVSSTAFGNMTRMVLAQAPTVFILEGGYDVAENRERPHGPLRDGVAATIESLLDVSGMSSDEVLHHPFALPDNYHGKVRHETKRVVQEVLDRINNENGLL